MLILVGSACQFLCIYNVPVLLQGDICIHACGTFNSMTLRLQPLGAHVLLVWEVFQEFCEQTYLVEAVCFDIPKATLLLVILTLQTPGHF